jgi:hypothetical protein
MVYLKQVMILVQIASSVASLFPGCALRVIVPQLET